jgi:hypothetical protein
MADIERDPRREPAPSAHGHTSAARVARVPCLPRVSATQSWSATAGLFSAHQGRKSDAQRSSGRAWQGTRERAHAFSRLLNQERVACLVRVRTTAFEELPSRKPKTKSTESNPNRPAGASDCRTRPPKTDQPEQPMPTAQRRPPLWLPAALAEGPVSEGTRAALTGRAAGNRCADRSRTSEPMRVMIVPIGNGAATAGLLSSCKPRDSSRNTSKGMRGSPAVHRPPARGGAEATGTGRMTLPYWCMCLRAHVHARARLRVLVHVLGGTLPCPVASSRLS